MIQLCMDIEVNKEIITRIIYDRYDKQIKASSNICEHTGYH